MLECEIIEALGGPVVPLVKQNEYTSSGFGVIFSLGLASFFPSSMRSLKYSSSKWAAFSCSLNCSLMGSKRISVLSEPFWWNFDRS